MRPAAPTGDARPGASRTLTLSKPRSLDKDGRSGPVGPELLNGIHGPRGLVDGVVNSLGPRGPDPGPPAGPTVIKRLSHV